MYDEIYNYTDSNFTIAYKNGKAGLIDTNTGKPITEFVYDIMENNLPRCVKGYKDHKVFEDELDFFFAMHSGINKDYCTMSKNYKWGLLNKKGEVVFDFKYKYPIKLLGILCRISGYYIANVEGYEGVIDKNSNIILEPIYDHIMESENYWSCEKDNLFGLADINGKMVAEIKYDSVVAVSSTRPCFIAEKDFKYGLITLNDEIISDFVYENLSSNNDGEFYIGIIDDKYGVINYEGKTILDFKYDYISFCTNENKKAAFMVNYKNKKELFDENGEKLWK